MDAIFELLIQLVLELLGEYLLERGAEGLVSTLQRRRGRWVLGFLAGLGFGCAWGAHLSGHPHYPRLLWVSVGFGVIAAVAALRRRSPRQIPPREIPPGDTPRARSSDRGLAGLAAATADRPIRARRTLRRRLVGALTTWDRDRFVGLVLINAGLALGVLLVFRRG